MARLPSLRRRTRRTVLSPREALLLDHAQGTVVVVERGCLWVTLERDPRDIILAQGMRFEIDRPGRTIVAAETREHAAAALAARPARAARGRAGARGGAAACRLVRPEHARHAAARLKRLAPAAVYLRAKEMPSRPAVITMVSPAANLPARISRASGFSISCWIARLSGRAP